MSNPMDPSEVKTASGIFLPPSEETAAAVLAARREVKIEDEAQQLAQWALAWERGGQPKPNKNYLQQVLLSRAMAWLWDANFMVRVFKRAVDLLDLEPHPTPETRQQRRHRERRGELRAVPEPPLDPQEEHHTDAG